MIGLSDNAGGWAKFERPKNACVFEGGRIWSSPHGRARASGPAALFALVVFFEAVALIGIDVYDALNFFRKKREARAGEARGAAAGRR